MYRYAILPKTKPIAKHADMGSIRNMKSFCDTVPFCTPGSMLVVLERICVSTVARTQCHVVRKKGNRKPHVVSNTLLNIICKMV